MDSTTLLAYMIAGSAAFVAGVVFLLLELRRKGLSIRAFLSYLCFLTAVVLLANQPVYALVAGAVLTALFLVLFLVYRKNARKKNGKAGTGT